MGAIGSIDQFKAQVSSDFARPNLFQVDLNFPSFVTSNATGTGNGSNGSADQLKKKGNFLVRAANLPSSQIGIVEVPFRGRVLKIAGDRTFEPWTITIQNDTGFVLRNAFEVWLERIQAYNENYTTWGSGTNTDDSAGSQNYFADMQVSQLARDARSEGADTGHKTIRKYAFRDVFPSNIAAIDLDFGNNDAIEEFTVELQVQYWEPVALDADE
jgi:hypothetical protein|tara:strand:- start:672 stop:1313 length:642 start_codon:yes stop_codon:yes gene_type:complete